MAQDVFVSHGSVDKQLAEQVCSCLESDGITCWIAPRDVPPGADWAGQIIKAIDECCLMIIIFSQSSLKSENIIREVQRACDKLIPILPLRVDGVAPSDSLAYFLGSRQWEDVSSSASKSQLNAVLAASKDRIGRQSEGNPFQVGLKAAESSFTEQQWAPSIIHSLSVLHKAFSTLLKDLLESSAERRVKKAIQTAQKKIGNVGLLRGRKQSIFKSFSLPQLVSLYREADVFHELRKRLRSNLHLSGRINWEHIAGVSHQAQGATGMAEFQEDDAAHMLYWTKALLYDFELVRNTTGPLDKIVPSKALTNCRSCDKKVHSDWTYCPCCGDILRLCCQSCNRPLKPAFRICPFCETPVHKSPLAIDGVAKAEDEYRALCRGAYFDGVLSVRERILLNEKRLSLGLDAETAEQIERETVPKNVVEYQRFVEGVLVDGKITDMERRFLEKKASQLGIDEWVASQIEDVSKSLMDTSCNFPGLGE